MPRTARERTPLRRATTGGLRIRAAALRAWLGQDRLQQWGCLLVLVFACAPCASMAWPARSAIPLEYQVKATYLYKLAPFVNWPSEAFAAPDTPFRICVVGDDRFADFLQNAVVGRRFGTHPFEVLGLGAQTPGVGCQILFISRRQTHGMGGVLAAVSGEPVLTVIDSGATVRGGIVQFVIDHGRVGFEIDTGAALRNHITISSKLLNLALTVRGEP